MATVAGIRSVLFFFDDLGLELASEALLEASMLAIVWSRAAFSASIVFLCASDSASFELAAS